MRSVDNVPPRLWGTPCPICEEAVTLEQVDDGVQLTFTGGEYRLVHQSEDKPCLKRGILGHFDPDAKEHKRLGDNRDV